MNDEWGWRGEDKQGRTTLDKEGWEIKDKKKREWSKNGKDDKKGT